ncbi:MAG: TIGR03084 family metal-binding protein [Pseudomonadota bacterium]
MQQARDFLDESRSLDAIVGDLSDSDLQTVTQFNSWTIDDVLGHLHMFNVAADVSLTDPGTLGDFLKPVFEAIGSGKSLIDAQNLWLDGLSGEKLRDDWRAGYEKTAAAFATADPKQRVEWAGPSMSARSSITARQMETWAHGQEVFDILGHKRVDEDRIKNIAHLGVNTFGWTFVNRGESVPEPAPHVVLTGPSGAVWTFNEEQSDNKVSGSATEFCQVVTQARNVADTGIVTVGDTATRWMAIAQCFAGLPVEPPAPGSRHVVER